MDQIAVVGLDIAKSVFQVHGVDGDGEVVVRRRLRRSRVLPFFTALEPCVIGIEACATSHHWARELSALGHDVRLMAPSYVKPYVKRQKNDAADAEAICEAVSRPTMRFVPVKTVEQQSVMVLHRTRLMLMRQRVRLSNSIRGHMAEYGIVAPIGRQGLQKLIEMIVDETDERVPSLARTCLQLLVGQLQLVNAQALETDRQIRASVRSSEVSRRLMEIPGVGPYSRARLSLRCQTPVSSAQGGTSPPGSGWCHDRTRAAGRNAWAASASRAIDTCGRCWSWARWR
jgi:transposase